MSSGLSDLHIAWRLSFSSLSLSLSLALALALSRPLDMVGLGVAK